MPQTSTLAALITRMEQILASLPRADGVASFTRLYLTVTQGVEAQLTGDTFADPGFLAQLDVRFADLFFAALDSAERDPTTAPRAWAPLFEARSQKRIAPLQFALAGMNAHINRDLPVALVASFEDARIELEEDTPQHADYLRVNQLLASVEADVKQQYLTGLLRSLDRLLHRVDRIDDVVANWDIERARDAAWTNAEALWALRNNHELYDSYLATLDRTVGFAGRGLLIPADTCLARVTRALARRSHPERV